MRDKQIQNATPARVAQTTIDDADGAEALLVVAKLCFEVDPKGAVRLAIPSAPVRFGPHRFEHVDCDEQLAGRYPDDQTLPKEGTDVIVLGTVLPLDGSQESQRDVSVMVAAKPRPLSKRVRIFGPRTWTASDLHGVAPSDPSPLVPTPLSYAMSYGGYDGSEPSSPVYESRNLLGSGVARDPYKLIGTNCPAIEDPDASLTSRKPAPAGFGPLEPSWEPRLSFAGTHDEAWVRDRAPLAPSDRDPRFYTEADPALWSERPLKGDEAIEVAGFNSLDPWRFRLPEVAIHFRSTIAGETSEHDSHLDTITVDADRGLVELCWRIAIALPRKAEQLKSIAVAMAPAIPQPLLQDLAERLNMHERALNEEPPSL